MVCPIPQGDHKKSNEFFQSYDHKCTATFFMNHSVYNTYVKLCFTYFVHRSITSSGQIGREIAFHILVHPEPV